jgi:hypothetical protein
MLLRPSLLLLLVPAPSLASCLPCHSCWCRYTASALSLMLAGFRKPIVMTGSQLPLALPRSDARQNLLDSLCCATASFTPPHVHLQEVAICFGGRLMRGNRASKVNSSAYQVRCCHRKAARLHLHTECTVPCCCTRNWPPPAGVAPVPPTGVREPKLPTFGRHGSGRAVEHTGTAQRKPGWLGSRAVRALAGGCGCVLPVPHWSHRLHTSTY